MDVFGFVLLQVKGIAYEIRGENSKIRYPGSVEMLNNKLNVHGGFTPAASAPPKMLYYLNR
jgi:hypothetical protein